MKQRAFSLLELMAVVAVLSILCVLLARLTGETQNVVGSNVRRMSADGQAQVVFDRIGTDLSRIVTRRDIPVVVNDSASGVLLRFFSSISSASPSSLQDRKASIISYRMASGTQSGSPLASSEVCFQRAAKSVSWGDTIMGTKANDELATFADVEAANRSLATAPADYDVLGQGVIRTCVGYRLRESGKLRSAPPPGKSLSVGEVSGFLVAMVVVDTHSAKLLSASQWTAIAAKFLDPPEDGNGEWQETPSGGWAAVLQDQNNFSGLPKVPIQSLGVYQRFFPIQSDR